MESNYITEIELWAYISKTADIATIEKIEQWKSSNDFNSKLYAQIESIYKTTENNNPSVNTAKNNFFKTINIEESKSYSWKNVFKYAAIFIFSVSTITYTYLQLSSKNQQVLVETNFGEQKQIALSDGSVVWLNASSKFSYNSETPRKVYLEGEAFFEVAKDKKHPFVVSTKDYFVKVLGTSFNVKSYLENTFTETVLFTGKVEITSNKQFKDKILMLPNDKVTFFRNSGEIVKSKVESIKSSTAWKEGRIEFKNKSFKEIANDLSIQFNIKISFKNERISNSKFTGSFDKSTPIDDILETLKLSKHFEYKKIKDNKWSIK
jgi:ferric-dicitrate binding protein FerR (iron transport regulator)